MQSDFSEMQVQIYKTKSAVPKKKSRLKKKPGLCSKVAPTGLEPVSEV